MAGLFHVMGFFLMTLSLVWIVLILAKMIAGWIFSHAKAPGRFWVWAGEIIELPANGVRLTVPTLYRNVDMAPWLTILVLVLLRTFVFRVFIYLGMLMR